MKVEHSRVFLKFQRLLNVWNPVPTTLIAFISLGRRTINIVTYREKMVGKEILETITIRTFQGQIDALNRVITNKDSYYQRILKIFALN